MYPVTLQSTSFYFKKAFEFSAIAAVEKPLKYKNEEQKQRLITKNFLGFIKMYKRKDFSEDNIAMDITAFLW